MFNACNQQTKNAAQIVQNPPEIAENAVDINTAGVHDLEKIPHVGEELAKKIVEHREKYGKFRRVENLILLRGMSDKKFRDIRAFVKTE